MFEPNNLYKIENKCSLPKVIYMCHKNLNDIQIYSQNWKKLNPEWEIKLYDNESCENFLLEEYSQLHADIFNFIPDGPIKADFWRVCVLYKYGGLYVDADIEPLVPLKDFIEDNIDFLTCIIFKNYYNPHFILARKDDDVLKLCIEQYINNYKNNEEYIYNNSYMGNYSIVNVFNKVFYKDIDKDIDKEGIYFINNKTYKFLLNVYENGLINEHSVYNGVRVFNNRYSNYDVNNHCFY
jgi:hypothetical protein